jgi:hypothetical protein
MQHEDTNLQNQIVIVEFFYCFWYQARLKSTGFESMCGPNFSSFDRPAWTQCSLKVTPR